MIVGNTSLKRHAYSYSEMLLAAADAAVCSAVRARLNALPERKLPNALRSMFKPNSRHAAVLIALYRRRPEGAVMREKEVDNDPLGDAVAQWNVLLLQRASRESDQHSGHVAFPGGHIEPGESPADAAIREAQEEVGLDPLNVEPLGIYKREAVAMTGVRVTTAVAFCHGKSGLNKTRVMPDNANPVSAADYLDLGRDLVPNPGEVAAIFGVPLSHLCDPTTVRFHYARDRRIVMPSWDIPGREEPLWGLTAWIAFYFVQDVFGAKLPAVPSANSVPPVPFE